MVDLEDLHVLLSFCCSKAGAVLLSMLTRPIAGTQCGTRVNRGRRERAGSVGWKKPAVPESISMPVPGTAFLPGCLGWTSA